MTKVSRKCQYALRAILELAKRRGDGPVSIVAITSTLATSDRFLDAVFVCLRRAGIIQTHRGRSGGYTLAIDPANLTVGSIISLIDGPPRPVDCQACGGKRSCSSRDDCAFADLWLQAEGMLSALYNSATFQDLLDGRRGDRLLSKNKIPVSEPTLTT